MLTLKGLLFVAVVEQIMLLARFSVVTAAQKYHPLKDLLEANKK